MMSQTVDFDPGMGNLVTDINTFINEAYSRLMNFKSISQKRTGFKLFSDKIYKGLENNIAFYYGCLLWAYYIKKQNKETPKDIEGNVFLNLSPAEIEEYDYLMQVNFIENYFDSYERDTQYYIGKKVSIPEKWKEILELYKEFLELNKGFINTKTTADLLLPEKFTKKTFTQDIEKSIQNAIKEKNLADLLNI